MILLSIQAFRVGASTTQTFTLQPGWNSIHLEVQPDNESPEAIFSGLPVEMVWCYFPTVATAEFIQNPAEGLWNVPGWNVYLPANQADAAALTNLHAIKACRSYLIRLGGSSPKTFTVTGAPIYREITWQPDGFTLTGLPLNPAVSVIRSGGYFFNSDAHRGQLRYRLLPEGTWIQVADSTVLRHGEAYWIFTKGGSEFTAPIEIDFGGGDRIDFGTDSETRKVTIRNRSAYPTTVRVSNPGSFPLLVRERSESTGEEFWRPFLDDFSVQVGAENSVVLTLGAYRANVTSRVEEILGFSAGGVLRQVMLSAENPASELSFSDAGLWVGSVTLSAVSEPNSATPGVLTPTPAEFTMRIILHVNGSGKTTLLKEVILMKEPNPTENLLEPGKFVLLSDPSLIPQFEAPGTRDGSPFASRISSVGFDFDGTGLELEGAFGSSLTGTLVLSRALPTNPFKHRYHPDHDDLTATYQPPPVDLPVEKQEVWDVTREIGLTFATGGPSAPSPGANYSETSGTYTETVSGLHREAITTTGNFTLRRLNTIDQLNPDAAE